MRKKEKKSNFRDTLNLPRTDFPIRSNAKIEDKIIVERWEKEELFTTSFSHNTGKSTYILHDGPPYANGNIHIGHAYNKILKDIVCKSQRMQDKHVPVTPGWDCHGLPIELKVSEEQRDKKLTLIEFQAACRTYAQKWVDIQRNQFKNLGVLMDWNNPYLTMNFAYEASVIRAFGFFVAYGYITKKNKTVPWCISCETVLALAEIEYKDQKDPSIYVLFPLEQKSTNTLFPDLAGKKISMLIWTTTPWTLPLNQAVLLKPKANYVILHNNDSYVIIGEQLADAFCSEMGIEKKIIIQFRSDLLLNKTTRVHHPFIETLTVPLIPSETVLLKEGTAAVHCAPGCGPEDYDIGVRNKLKIFSPVSPAGYYTSEVIPKELVGMSVNDGQIWVIKKLAQVGALLFKKNIRHPYPHCWRCHKKLIFRATKQWFCDLSQHNLMKRTLKEIKKIKSYPKKSANQLQATLEGRLEWCLSRQRVWGIPIPAIICVQCDTSYTDQSLADRVAKQIATHGIEYWNTVSIQQLIPDTFSCSHCGGKIFEKERDILDVWFDAGVSHYAVLLTRDGLVFPANMYLEGKDQHRGWFQSSLLTALVIEGELPTDTILTHGYTVDKKGHKMSKSVGNVISPQEMIDQLGTDGLRLWSASIDYTDDAIISDVLIKNVREVFRKIRNTARFLLSNIYDFNIQSDAPPLDTLLPIDRYALYKLHELNHTIIRLYNAYDFTGVTHALSDYCTRNLSSFYLDIIKDRLYVEKASGFKRRSAQTACWYILDTLTRLIAPILSFTAEQISDQYQKNKTYSIHLQNFATLSGDMLGESDEQWTILKEVRIAVLKEIEYLREKKLIHHSLEATITLYLDSDVETIKTIKQFFNTCKKQKNFSATDFLKELLIVSNIVLAETANGLSSSKVKGLYIQAKKALGDKCPRCWHWQQSNREDKLCNRCQNIIYYQANFLS